jgi:hypothetical protein
MRSLNTTSAETRHELWAWLDGLSFGNDSLAFSHMSIALFFVPFTDAIDTFDIDAAIPAHDSGYDFRAVATWAMELYVVTSHGPSNWRGCNKSSADATDDYVVL